MADNGETTLYLLCGKIASGKSTWARALARRPSTVLIDMDRWMSILFPTENASVEDFVRLSARLRVAMQPLVVDILRSGPSVVLDFPANTVGWRAWMKGIVSEADVAHELHVFDVPDEVCKARLRRRNQSGDHAYVVDERTFDLIGRHFVPPSPDEGFNVIVHRSEALPD
ncbi:AAA family ATPase [Palleronia sp. KMU-117]|uniref:AAA family ATPase n=1 Tax=Palleronia sp. KMU-117 TaxID=3434108 RepID=UPI003D731697